MRDPYAVLGVAKKASPETIKQAYRALAKRYHPDMAGPGRSSAQRFQEINAAYDLLKNSGKRLRYDRGEIHANGAPAKAKTARPRPRTAPPPPQRRAARAGKGQARPTKPKTEWRTATFATRQKSKIAGMGREAMEKMASTGSTLKKAAQEKGTTIRSHVEKQKSARKPKSPNLEMDTQPSPADDILSDIFTTVRPSHTEVAAEDGRDVNYTLDISFEESALGLTRRVKLPDGRRLEVEIPKGVKNGQRIRLRGEGTQGKGEGLPGDALIKIGVEPHPFFSRSGNDINLTLPVTVDEAVLGAKVMVPTLTDPVAITVPPGSNTDTRIVIETMGFAPDTGEADQKNGDQVIILKVILPSPKDTVFSRLVRRWATKNPYNVRDEFDICARAG